MANNSDYRARRMEVIRSVDAMQAQGLMPTLTLEQAVALLPANPEWDLGIRAGRRPASQKGDHSAG